ISENIAEPSKPDLLEEKLRSQLEEEKRRYKSMFTHLKALKVEIEHLQLLMDKTKVKLQKEFEAWWAEEASNLQVNPPSANSLEPMKSFPPMPDSQPREPQLLPNRSDVDARKTLPSPLPALHSQEQDSTGASLEDSGHGHAPGYSVFVQRKKQRAAGADAGICQEVSLEQNAKAEIGAAQSRQSPGHAMPRAGLCSCWGGRVLPLLLAYVCYLLLGACIFQLLEKQAEAQSRDQFQLEKLRFLENYTCLDQWALEQFVQVILEAWVKGVNPKGNSTNPSNWDFGSSFFFAGTVVTTIGYGNLAPSTEAGQVFCVFYALVGIPLNVVFLNHLGTGLRAHLMTLERWEDQPRRTQLLQILGLALFMALGTLVVLIFPPMVFSHVEGWSLGEGFYFAFITLSTIGFGDYVVVLVQDSKLLPPQPAAMCSPKAQPVPPEGRARGCRMPRTALLLLAYLAHLALGTTVFWMLESPAAKTSSRRFQRDKWALLQNFTCMDGPALELLIRGIIQAYKSGHIVFDNTTSMGRWELEGSFFFSVSTITTIGYGNLSPRTTAARLFCFLFVLVGIPLHLVVINQLGNLMQRGVHNCTRRLRGAWQDAAKARGLAGSGVFLSGLLLFLLLPPLLFSHVEGWSYMESFYFAFVTLSTVGYGDYVIGMNPSRSYPALYKCTVSLWILFGMAWLASIIKPILPLLEPPRRPCSCYRPRSSKGDFKSKSWRQCPDGEEDGEAEPHSPQPDSYPEGPVRIVQHPEAAIQKLLENMSMGHEHLIVDTWSTGVGMQCQVLLSSSPCWPLRTAYTPSESLRALAVVT
ncbi:Potassium channel subfamily K member 17, partial [Galemys pyrenaicus]